MKIKNSLSTFKRRIQVLDINSSGITKERFKSWLEKINSFEEQINYKSKIISFAKINDLSNEIKKKRSKLLAKSKKSVRDSFIKKYKSNLNSFSNELNILKQLIDLSEGNVRSLQSVNVKLIKLFHELLFERYRLKKLGFKSLVNDVDDLINKRRDIAKNLRALLKKSKNDKSFDKNLNKALKKLNKELESIKDSEEDLIDLSKQISSLKSPEFEFNKALNKKVDDLSEKFDSADDQAQKKIDDLMSKFAENPLGLSEQESLTLDEDLIDLKREIETEELSKEIDKLKKELDLN